MRRLTAPYTVSTMPTTTHPDFTEPGCYLDSHRGHYIQRDVVQFAMEYGYIVSPAVEWMLVTYTDHYHKREYPISELDEVVEHATEWLNSGETECAKCGGIGIAPEGSDEYYTRKNDPDGIKRCRACTGTGRGERMSGQNYPPRKPDGYHWGFIDGDFGLYCEDDE